MASILICAFIVLVQSAIASDPLASFLERHQLHELLAAHLDERIEHASGEEREALILHLASIYASLLEKERDDEKRARLEDRSRRLLSRAPPDTADELRLALLRASYLRAEQVSERHRLRMASEDEVARAATSLAETIPELQRLVNYYDSAISILNARLARATGFEAGTLYEQVDRMQRMRGSCRFLLAWSMYYHAWLAGETSTGAAERLFAEILRSDVPRPQPADIARDLRAFEPMARAIVGMALCRSLSGTGASSALGWIELLDDELTYEPVRAEAPGWRLVILLEHSAFREALVMLREHLDASRDVPVVWLRLAAAGALEDERHAVAARDLAHFAVARLAAVGELEQIHDLAKRYGPERLGASGFAVRYVNGLILYNRAREIDEGSGDPSATGASELYAQAVDELEAALREADAREQPRAAAACRRLIGWALFFKGEYRRASMVFETAAREFPTDDPEAAETLWMAIVALDRLVQNKGGRAMAGERSTLIERFLAEHPSHPHVASLLVDRAMRADAGELSDDEIAALLEIAPEHESYDPARRRVAYALYQRFRNAPSAARRAHGEAFLRMAMPLLERRAAFGDRPDATAQASRLVHVRRILEVALHEQVVDAAKIEAARAALAAASVIETFDSDLVAAHRNEIDYRLLQERLHSNDVESAASLAGSLRDHDPNSIWSRLASRAIFQHANRRWKDGNERTEVLRLVVQHGGHVLREFDTRTESDRRSAIPYYAATAEASFILWKHHGERDEGPRALFLYRFLLTLYPRQPSFLRPAAILAGDPEIGDYEFAAECWRMLSAGTATDSNAWYEARLGLMRALARIDPARAREVMNQHRLLNPDYGPSPWGDQLRALHEELRQAEVGG